ncbi:MAG: glycosyltransferase family 39 protein [Isosphaeraceae bacterium]
MVPWLGLFADGFLIAGGWWLAGPALGQARVVDRILATGVLAFAWCVLGIELLGSFGLLEIGPVLTWAGALGALGLGARTVLPPPANADAKEIPPRAPWRWDALIALGLVFWVSAVLGMTSLLLPVKVVSDGPIYHLYFAARWWKAGRLFLIPVPFGENAATYFPANGDLWFTWLMVTWGGDRLARIGQAPFLMLAALAVWGIARRLGASPSATLLAACWFVTSTPLLIFTFEANVDSIFVAGYLTAVYFFLSYPRFDGGVPAILLGGLAAGLALGTKPVGVVFIPPLLCLVLGAIAVKMGSVRRVLAALLVMLAGLGVASGFWYGRNLLLTGNLLYPLHVNIFGKTVFQGWYGRDAMQFSPYYLPLGQWRALVDTVLAVLDPRLAPLWLAALAGAWAIRANLAATDRRVWAMSLLAVLNVVLWWVFIPYRTQQRFFLQALGLAAVPLARLLDRSVWLARAATVLLALHVLTPQPWPLILHDGGVLWDLSPIIPNLVPAPLRLFDPVGRSGQVSLKLAAASDVILLLAAGCCALVAAWAVTRSPVSARGRLGKMGLGLLALLGLVVLAALETGAVGTDARLLIYPGFRDFYRGWQNLESRSGPAGARVAYAGTNIPYYLQAGGLRNDVFYVNVDAHRDWLLHDYHKEAIARGEPTWPNSRPGWDRANPDFSAWLANLRARGIQLLVVTHVNPGEGPHNVADAEGFPIEKVWAERHPDLFEPLYGVAERDPLFRLYRLRPTSWNGSSCRVWTR